MDVWWQRPLDAAAGCVHVSSPCTDRELRYFGGGGDRVLSLRRSASASAAFTHSGSSDTRRDALLNTRWGHPFPRAFADFWDIHLDAWTGREEHVPSVKDPSCPADAPSQFCLPWHSECVRFMIHPSAYFSSHLFRNGEITVFHAQAALQLAAKHWTKTLRGWPRRQRRRGHKEEKYSAETFVLSVSCKQLQEHRGGQGRRLGEGRHCQDQLERGLPFFPGQHLLHHREASSRVGPGGAAASHPRGRCRCQREFWGGSRRPAACNLRAGWRNRASVCVWPAGLHQAGGRGANHSRGWPAVPSRLHAPAVRGDAPTGSQQVLAADAGEWKGRGAWERTRKVCWLLDNPPIQWF